MFHDLSKDGFLAQLMWNSLKKRRRSGSWMSSQMMHHKNSDNKSSSEVIKSHACEGFVLPMSFKVDHENCKYVRDSLFSSTVAQPLPASWVMSRG